MLSNEAPLVSIIIPAYNAENTIVETIISAQKQTYPHTEIIIVNDGSTDNTGSVVSKFIAGKSNISLYTKENQGLSATRNYGFLRSKGEFLVFLDSDDLLAEAYVRDCLNKFLEDHNLSIVHTQTMFFERVTGLFELPPFSPKMILITNCITATAMIKRSQFEEVGMYDENLFFCEDWDLWIRLTAKHPYVHKIEKPLFFYRRRNTQDSMSDRDKILNVSEQAAIYIYQKKLCIVPTTWTGYLQPVV